MAMIRKTRQREVLKQVLEEANRPLTPNEIHELAQQSYPAIGLRTVYRHLNELSDTMEIAGIDYPGLPVHYEKVDQKGSRPHLICRECRRVLALPIPEPQVPYPEVDGHEISGHEVLYYGVCKNCRGQ